MRDCVPPVRPLPSIWGYTPILYSRIPKTAQRPDARLRRGPEVSQGDAQFRSTQGRSDEVLIGEDRDPSGMMAQCVVVRAKQLDVAEYLLGPIHGGPEEPVVPADATVRLVRTLP